MAIPEDILDLWSEFPLQLKTEPLDDLFNLEPKTKKPIEAPISLINYNASKRKDIFTSSLPDLTSEQFENSLEVLGSDGGMVGATLKASKLYAYEDFHSFLVREGGIDPERLSRLIDNVSPKPDEDFASFLARTNGIKDEQMVNRLRQSLKLEPAIEFKSENVEMCNVSMKANQELMVGDGEDAASFFVRAGSWESSSSISEELALVGLDEFVDEDAESFFRRTDSLSENELESEHVNGSQSESPALITLAETRQVEALKDEVLVQVNGLKEQDLVQGRAHSEPTPMDQDKVVVLKKRKSLDKE